ncbi:DUF3592 domain-containing protein [Tessaracoccus antarcticus]|uniref:DUF3592 domain-containing protein n=1 Tax=Tessaracoccus antarcticus TaxID=2479848 RepID=A0A3M0G2G6_9ACTN|nr:DUF3592 domain-containing protein [Tessaracoccus antarcticus]RMB58965.1 DUF3592 domain-containing protein [Tessaracoccus antarcticus]
MFTLIALLAVVASVATGSLVLARGRRSRDSAQDFVRTGIHTQARVLELRDHEWDLARRGSLTDQRAWFPYVEFNLPDGRSIRGESMTGARPAPARVGELVSVVYDPASPERLMVMQGLAKPGIAGAFSGVLGFFMVGFGIVIFGFWVLLKLVLKVPF